MNNLQHEADVQRDARHPLQLYIIWDTEIERVTAIVWETSPQHALASDQFAQDPHEREPANWQACDPDLPTARAIVYAVPPDSPFRPRQADANRLSHANLSNHADHVGAFVCHQPHFHDIRDELDPNLHPVPTTIANDSIEPHIRDQMDAERERHASGEPPSYNDVYEDNN